MNPATADFVGKWLAFEPEGRLTANFLDPASRNTCLEFAALLFELEDVALRIAEPAVAEAKLVWWQDELERAGRGAARHPLTQALAAHAPGASFAGLSAPLSGLYRFESASDDLALAAAFEAWCAALSTLAAGLTASPRDAWPLPILKRQFLLRRLREIDAQARLGRLWVPLDLVAREQVARHQLVGDGADETAARVRGAMARRLLAQPTHSRALHPLAAIQHALAELRLEGMARDGRDRLPPLRALWRSWRAARTPARLVD